MAKERLFAALCLMATPALAQDRAAMEIPVPSPQKAVAPEPQPKPESEQAAAPTQAQSGNAAYAQFEVFHLDNYYYGTDQKPLKSEPSVQTKLQLGLTMRGGALDVYGTIGAIKMPDTQKVVQRRTEMEADFYPIRDRYGSVVIYNRLELPFSDADYDKDNAKVGRQGTVYTLGATPRVQVTTAVNGVNILFSLAADMWSSFASRRQYIESDETATETDRAFFLTKAEEGQPVEAQSPPLHDEILAGFGLYPLILRSMLFEAAVVSTHDHKPAYFINEDETVSFKYRTERTSHYRIGLTYQVSRTLSITNDFYHFHQGFFEERATGDEDRRYRNIFKVSCRL